jgi:hypothetical protein
MNIKHDLLALGCREPRIQRLIQLHEHHLMYCASKTKTHPCLLGNMSTANPAWPASAQRSFRAALKIDKHLKGFFNHNMIEDLRIHHGQGREEDNDCKQIQKLLPLWWRMVCGLESEPKSGSPTPVSEVVASDWAQTRSSWQIRPQHRR